MRNIDDSELSRYREIALLGGELNVQPKSGDNRFDPPRIVNDNGEACGYGVGIREWPYAYLFAAAPRLAVKLYELREASKDLPDQSELDAARFRIAQLVASRDRAYRKGVEDAARFIETHAFVEPTQSGSANPVINGFLVVEVASIDPKRVAQATGIRTLKNGVYDE